MRQVDNDVEDVEESLSGYRLTPYQTYVGSRYDRAWTRTIIADDDLRLNFILMEAADAELMHSSPYPQIEGRDVSWSLKAGQRLVLYDNQTPLRIFHPNAQTIDAIQVTPANN